MSKQEVILCEKLESSLTNAIGNCPHDKLFILTDEHTHRLCLPQLNDIPALERGYRNYYRCRRCTQESGNPSLPFGKL